MYIYTDTHTCNSKFHKTLTPSLGIVINFEKLEGEIVSGYKETFDRGVLNLVKQSKISYMYTKEHEL